MSLETFDYSELLDRLGLVDDSSPENIERVLKFLESKGRKQAYADLFAGFFSRNANTYDKEPPDITPERFIHSIQTGIVTLSKIIQRANNGLMYLVSYLQKVQGMGEEEVMNFFYKYDKHVYKLALEHQLIYSHDGIDSQIISGKVNPNLIKQDMRPNIIVHSQQPKKIFKYFSPAKQVSVAYSILSKDYGNDEAIKTCIPTMKQYFSKLIEAGDIVNVYGFANDILMKRDIKNSYIKEFCPLINIAIEKFDLKKYPFNLPRFKSCNKKLKHLSAFDFVSNPDEWNQRIVKVKDMWDGHKLGIINEKGKVIVEPTYKRIGLPNSFGTRIAISFGGRLDKINQRGEVVK